MDILQVDDRFCGPPGTGNGGYVAGRLAALFPAGMTVEVTLRRPVPLRQPLKVSAAPSRIVLLGMDGETLAEAHSTGPLWIEAPPAPGGAETQAASHRFAGHAAHSFPHCFVCGPGRAEGDGLRIFPGPVADRPTICAGPWVPDATLADTKGKVLPEFIWAALDCPGASAVGGVGLDRPMLLGRITACLFHDLRAGEAASVQAWKLGQDGRKHRAGSAVYGQDGRLCGLATAIWFDISLPAEEEALPHHHTSVTAPAPGQGLAP
jgi:hypothetical protein